MGERPVRGVARLIFLCAALAAMLCRGAGAMSKEEILNGAEARIGKYRTTMITVRVTHAGKPVGGARVEIEQVRHAFLFGANIFKWWMEDEKLREAYRERFAELLNYATLPFYWPYYERQRGRTRAREIRQCAQWCNEHGITTKGHPLVWNYSAPAWLPRDTEEIVRLSDRRVRRCVRQFAGLIDIFDVVNEATDPWRFDNPITDAWRKVGQIAFAVRAFKIARAANPNATLLINDYRTDAAYERVIEQLVDERGKPLYDVIGIQSHMHGGVWPVEKQWEVCERFARFGVPLHFTETTIVSGPKTKSGWRTTPEGEERQAEETARFYTVLFSHPAVQAITWWDFSDYRAWQGAPAGFLRKDMSPKPVYFRLMELIKGKWWTRASGKTKGDGTLRRRVFYGEHRVHITAPDGTKRTRRISVLPGGKVEFEVRL